MRLEELINGLPIEIVHGASDLGVGSIVEDSRRVEEGALFVARVGAEADGRRFIGDAIARGAYAVLVDRASALDSRTVPAGVAVLACDDVALMTAHVAERFHGSPSRRLALVGITGTNGKTTVACLVHQLLERAGTRCGLIGTIGTNTGEPDMQPAALTTPPAVEVSELLGRMVGHGCRACAMEISSHALAQGRAAALRLAGGVFTNLSGDHLDYHGTMDAYCAAKTRLFAALEADAWAVVNADDPAAARMADACACRVLTTSLTDETAVCHATIAATGMDRTACTFRGPFGTIDVALPLPGHHNVANALQAAAVAHALGLDGGAIAKGLAHCRAPAGRLEVVTGPDDGFTVLVDYAHTDDALDNVLRALRPIVPPRGRLWVVFGCGGDRDRVKRPRMAAAACRWADHVVVTSDNPRTEDPSAIIGEIMSGVPEVKRAGTRSVLDRSEAIRAVIGEAGPEDVVLVAGKGHEDYQIVGRERRPFDDRAIARAALAARRDGRPTS